MIKTNRHIFFIIIVLAFFSFWNGGMSIVYGDAWKIRRTDREEIVIRRLKKILRKQPLSAYAFKQLMRYYRKRRYRQKLISRYLKLAHQYPKIIAYKIILARIYRWQRDFARALYFYNEARKIHPQQQVLILGAAASLLGLKRKKEAFLLYKSILPHLRGRALRDVLKKMLNAALYAKDKASVLFVWKRLTKQSFSHFERLVLARLLVREQYIEQGLREYKKVLRKSRGKRRISVLLELSRVEMNAKQYKQALFRLRQARKIHTTLRWIKEELLAREVEIHRRQKKLTLLIQRLAWKWQKTKNYKHIILLARLYYETKNDYKGMLTDKRALKLRPREREPRLRLMKWLIKNNRGDEAKRHLRLLIKYKKAEPKHYINLARELLRQVRIYSFTTARWHPRWAKKYICRNNNYKRYSYRYKYRYKYRRYGYHRRGYYNVKTKLQCSKVAWRHYRIKRLKKWRTSSRYSYMRQKIFNEAIHLLELCMRRYPRRWESLRTIEHLFDKYGKFAKSERALRLLVKATGNRIGDLMYMRELLFRVQKPATYRKILEKLMRQRRVAPRLADQLVSFIYKNWFERQEQSRLKINRYSTLNTYVAPKIWSSSPCRPIRRFLRSVLNKVTPHYIEKKPLLILRLTTLAKVCGSTSRKIKKLQLSQQKLFFQEPDGLQQLLKIYFQYQYDKGIGWLFSRLFNQKKPQWIFSYLVPLLNKYRTTSYSSILRQIHRQFPKQPDFTCKVIQSLCKRKHNCLKASGYLNKLILDKRVSPIEIMKIMYQLSRYNLRIKERFMWSQILMKRYWNNSKVLQWMLEHRLLNMRILSYRLRKRLSPKMRKLYGNLLLRVLDLRFIAPKDLKKWKIILASHLRSIGYFYKEKKQFLAHLELHLKKFPALRRKVLEYFLSYYRYRKYGIKLLKNVLKNQPQIEDIWILRRYYGYLGKNRHKILIDIIKGLTRPEEIGMIEFFAKDRAEMLPIQIVALKKLLKLRPTDIMLMKRLARSLDRLGDFQQADLYWTKIFSLAPHHSSLLLLKKVARYCCADEASELYARRLFFISMKTKSLKTLWSTLLMLIPKLSKKQQKLFIGYLLKNKTLSTNDQLQLVELLYQEKLSQVAIKLFYQLFQKKRLKTKHYRQFASLLDRENQYIEAYKYWKIYYQRQHFSSKNQFRKLAKNYQQKGEYELARIFFYRSLLQNKNNKIGNVKNDSARVLEEYRHIKKLRQKGDSLQAWARWLYLQKKAGSYCLSKSSLHPSTHIIPSRLWQLNTEYRGPFTFFKRCQWDLSVVATQTLPYLVNFMKKNTDFILKIRGSADSKNEPDYLFLARQRGLSLRLALVKRGISPKRIKLMTMNNKMLVGSRDYRRQISLGDTIIQQSAFVLFDADKDHVRDIVDRCPFVRKDQSLRSYGRRYRRRYRRYRYFSSKRRRLSSSRKRQSQSQGCPISRLQRTILIKGIHKKTIKLLSNLYFYRNSYSLNYASQKLLQQVAAYLRLAPYLGNITIEYTLPNKTRRRRKFGIYRRNKYYSYKYRRYYNRRTPRWIAIKRLQYIRSYLISRGVSAYRLRKKVLSSKGKTQHISFRQPLIVFRINQ